MEKLGKRLLICLLAAVVIGSAGLIRDRRMLREQLVRLHVVANSDEAGDQAVKLQVRDAVLAVLREDLAKITDAQAAKAYLQENLPKIRAAADMALQNAGVTDTAAVSLCREAFDIREYDTFSLPAGVYHSLRIVIGEGRGHNWWCVSFPSLCVPSTKEQFVQTAADAGFSDSLSGALAGEEDYQIRFFLLDQLGRLENMFFAG